MSVFLFILVFGPIVLAVAAGVAIFNSLRAQK